MIKNNSYSIYKESNLIKIKKITINLVDNNEVVDKNYWVYPNYWLHCKSSICICFIPKINKIDRNVRYNKNKYNEN